MGKTSFELIPTAPYIFDLQWRFYYSSTDPQPEIYEDGIWRRVFKIGNRLVPVAVTSIGTVEKPKLMVNTFSKLNAKEKRDLSDKITDIFRLQALANVDENELKVCKLSRQKSRYIKELALKVANGLCMNLRGHKKDR
jgi:hypothetical protein